MSNYQRYQKYRLHRDAPQVRFWRFLLWSGIIILVIVLGRGVIFGHSGPAVSTDQNTNANTGAATVKANSSTNGSINANSNTNSSIPAAPGTTLTAADCSKPISQYGTDKKIALTFDGGAATGTVDHVLLILREEQTPGSFFLTGAWARNNPDIVKKISAAGYGVYNHSDTHPHFPALTAEELSLELTKADESISALTGQSTKPFFRPPYGDYTEATTAAVRSAGYCSILWTVDALDWQDGQTAEAAQQRVLDKARSGGIVLMHVGDELVPKFLRETIRALKAQGYQLVSLENLLVK